jgi:hypothetical protein
MNEHFQGKIKAIDAWESYVITPMLSSFENLVLQTACKQFYRT